MGFVAGRGQRIASSRDNRQAYSCTGVSRRFVVFSPQLLSGAQPEVEVLAIQPLGWRHFMHRHRVLAATVSLFRG